MITQHNRGRSVGYLIVSVITLLSLVASLTLGVALGDETVSIGSTGAFPDESVTAPIVVGEVTNLGGGTLTVWFDTSIVHVTDVKNGSGTALTVIAWKINNSSNPGSVKISAYSTSGESGNVTFADVTYKAVGSIGETSALGVELESLFDTSYTDIVPTVVNGSFRVKDTIAPDVTNATATPGTILNDNGRPRAAGTNISQIAVTVTDNDVGVASVTIDLTPIGGSAAQPMALISGTDMNGVWSVTTNASAGINLTNNLVVNATDNDGNSNTAVSVQLEVLRRGDVVRDNVVNLKDMTYIARSTVGLEPEASAPPTVFLTDVVGNAGAPTGDARVDMKDALYIARWVIGLEDEP